MIDQKQVEYIAQLARLGLNKKEVAKMQKELASILDYIDLLNQADTSGVKVIIDQSCPIQELREDKTESENQKTKQIMLDQAPKTERGFVGVKKILG